MEDETKGDGYEGGFFLDNPRSRYDMLKVLVAS